MTEQERESVAMGDSTFEAPQTFYVRWALGDDGSLRIRKWSQFPFDGATEYAAALSSRPVQEPVAVKPDLSWLSSMTYDELETTVAFLTVEQRETLRKFVHAAPQPAHGTSATDPAPSVRVGVKPLIWRAMWAETPFGCYKIDKIMSEPINGPGSPRSDEEVSYQPSFNGMTWGNIFGSMEMAKEYCQRHFDERVLAALATPTPKEESK